MTPNEDVKQAIIFELAILHHTVHHLHPFRAPDLNKNDL
jgi:hypothetical protein